MTKNMKCFFIFGTLFTIGTVLFAQNAESDFETKANTDGTVTITKYVGWDSKVTIPATIGGKAVTAIGESAFAKQENLTSVSIPDSVTVIGESAFSTNKLTSVTFSKGLVSIGKNAFYDNSLASVALPDTVKSIGERAFSHNLLARITIPGSNCVIGKFAFARNKQLTSVTLGSLFTFDNDYANTGRYELQFSSFIEEDAVTSDNRKRWDAKEIGNRGWNLFVDYVCNDRKAGTYTPDLKYRAPKKDGDFEYVETRYGAALTRYNGTAASIQIPEKAGGLAVKYLHSSTFSRKTVERVRIPNTVTSIGDEVFYDKGLTSVAIPDSVTYIGYKAFSCRYSNSTLASVTVGKNVATIGAGAFSGQKLTSVTIPNSVLYIGEQTFRGNNLTGVVIPDSVKIIDSGAFAGANGFSVGKDYEGGSLTSVSIGKNVTAIGDSAFSGNKLTSVVIPDSVMTIGDSAFSNNELTSVAIPDSVKTIGEYAFDYALANVTIGSGVALDNDAIRYGFVDYYNNNGKRTGVYTCANREWTYAER